MKQSFMIILVLIFSNRFSIAQCNRNTVIVNVIDQTGRRLNSLSKEDLSVTIDGKPSSVIGVHDLTPIPKILFLIDRSGSMSNANSGPMARPAPLEDASRFAILDLLKALPDHTQAAVAEFSKELGSMAEFSRDRKQQESAVQQIFSSGQAHGRTAMRSAISNALKRYSSLSVGDSVVIITDGGDNDSKEGANELKLRLQKAGIRVFFQFLVADLQGTAEEIRGPFEAGDISTASGGSSFLTAVSTLSQDSLRIQQINRELVARIFDAHVLELPVSPLGGMQKLKIKIANTHNVNLKKAQLEFPRQINLCSN